MGKKPILEPVSEIHRFGALSIIGSIAGTSGGCIVRDAILISATKVASRASTESTSFQDTYLNSFRSGQQVLFCHGTAFGLLFNFFAKGWNGAIKTIADQEAQV
jgi:hypothetical protein